MKLINLLATLLHAAYSREAKNLATQAERQMTLCKAAEAEAVKLARKAEQRVSDSKDHCQASKDLLARAQSAITKGDDVRQLFSLDKE